MKSTIYIKTHTSVKSIDKNEGMMIICSINNKNSTVRDNQDNSQIIIDSTDQKTLKMLKISVVQKKQNK